MKTSQAIVAVLAVSMIVGASAYQLGMNSGQRKQARRDAFLVRRAERDRYFELGKEVEARVTMAGRLRDLSTADFEKRFGPLVKLDPAKKDPDAPRSATHRWTDPKSHRTFHFCFKDDVLMTTGSNFGDDDIAPYLPSIEELVEQMMNPQSRPLARAR